MNGKATSGVANATAKHKSHVSGRAMMAEDAESRPIVPPLVLTLVNLSKLFELDIGHWSSRAETVSLIQMADRLSQVRKTR